MAAIRHAISLLCAVALLAMSAGGATQEEEDRQSLSDFARTTLRIETPSGRALSFQVYVAHTMREHMQGLMFVQSLPADTGMLFPFEPPRPASMWMRHALIPLDMLFIREDGTVANIIADAAPQSLDTRNSDGPVAFVLELNGGTAARLGIVAGARVHIAPLQD
jgi:uncharacterized membrane protein (UPF0127 family)